MIADPVTFEALCPDGQAAALAWWDGDAECAAEYVYRAETIPMTEAIERISTSEEVDTYRFKGDFWAYHRWYLSVGDMPDHGASRWPVIGPYGLSGLDDGWHRFHSYVAAGDTTLTLLHPEWQSTNKEQA